MSELALTNCKLWLAGYDFSGNANALAMDYSADMVDVTAFGDTTRSRIGGLKDASFAHTGFVDLSDNGVDEVFFSKVGVVDELMSVAPTTGANGEPVYFGKIATAKYSPSGQLGDAMKFSVDGNATGPLIRGKVLKFGTVTSTGTGTAYQSGAVGASEYAYAGLHVLGASGTLPTLDVVIQSSADQAFTSPTTRFTFAQKSAIGAQYMTPVAGAITDTWWRTVWTLAGTDPSFTIAVVLGIK